MITINIANIALILIHIGDNTHHQDQFILSNSLRTINTIVNNPTNPIPLLEDVSVDIYLFKVFG